MAIKIRNGSSAWSTGTAIKVRNGSSAWSSVTTGRVRGPSGWQTFFTSQTTVDIALTTNYSLGGQPSFPSCSPDVYGYWPGSPYFMGSSSPSTYRGVAFPNFYTVTNYISNGIDSCDLDPNLTYQTVWNGPTGDNSQVFDKIEFYNSSYTSLLGTLEWSTASNVTGSNASWDNVITFNSASVNYLRIYYTP